MKTRFLSSIIFLFAFASLTFAQKNTNLLLEGTVGKVPIIMEINIHGKEIFGAYYYKKYKKSLELSGKYVNENSIELVFEHWDDKETFLLKNNGKGNEILYTGTWHQDGKSNMLPVTLKPIDRSRLLVKNAYVKRPDISEFNYVRLSDVTLRKVSTQKLNEGFLIDWLQDTLSGFSIFRIQNNKNAKGIDSINSALEEIQFEELLSYLDCGGYEYKSEVSSVYVRNQVLSFAVSTSYDCGGVHPDFGTHGYTFNTQTGKQMELTDFLFFGITKKDYPESEAYKFTDEVMGPNIVKLLTKLYPMEMKKPNDDNECDYSDQDPWEYVSWYLTENGLYLYPYFYRAARMCDGADFSFIPYDVLVKYKNPKVSIPMKY